MAKSKKPETPAKSDAEAKDQDAPAKDQDAPGIEDSNAAADDADSIAATDAHVDDTVTAVAQSESTDPAPEDADRVSGPDADTPDTTSDDTVETELADMSEAQVLAPAGPEPALDADAASVVDPDLAELPEDDIDAEPALPLSGADPEGTGPAPTGTDLPTPDAGPVTHEKIIERKGGFVPMLLGGVLAAVAGFGLSQYLGGDLFGDNDAFADETRAALSEQSANLDALNGKIDGLAADMPVIDLTSVETAIAGLSARSEELGAVLGDVTARLDTLSGDAAAIGDRVTELEKAPVEEAVSPAAIEAYEQEIARLREEVQATLSDVEAQRQEISAIAEEAVAAERNAETRANRAELRSAVAELKTEVDAGRPFDDALAPLTTSGMLTVPEVLSANAADGVATQAQLIADYPGAARDALGAARNAAAGEEGGNPLSSFLAEQLGARSVTPRDGDSADAILSRAEAAVQGGDLTAAINEISSLPKAAQAALQDWVTRAETRAAALAATDALSAELDTE